MIPAEEEVAAFRGGEKEAEDSGEKDVAAEPEEEEEERSISAPLVLSQEKLEKVYRKLQSLQEQVTKLQVSRGRREGPLGRRQDFSGDGFRKKKPFNRCSYR